MKKSKRYLRADVEVILPHLGTRVVRTFVRLELYRVLAVRNHDPIVLKGDIVDSVGLVSHEKNLLSVWFAGPRTW